MYCKHKDNTDLTLKHSGQLASDKSASINRDVLMHSKDQDSRSLLVVSALFTSQVWAGFGFMQLNSPYSGFAVNSAVCQHILSLSAFVNSGPDFCWLLWKHHNCPLPSRSTSADINGGIVDENCWFFFSLKAINGNKNKWNLSLYLCTQIFS